jgi:hypothetical protein
LPRSEGRNPAIERELDQALAALPDRYRLPLILHHLQGHTQEDVASSLKVAPGTIAWRLHHGRELLRRRLAQAGISASSGVFMSTLASASTEESTSALVSTNISDAIASEEALDWAAEMTQIPMASGLLVAVAVSSAVLIGVLAFTLPIQSTSMVAAEVPPSLEQAQTDAADCYRRAVAALPPDLVPARKSVAIDPDFSAEAARRRRLRIERLLAEAPEVVRLWHQGARCTTCRFSDDDRAHGGMREAMRGMLTDAAMLELDRSLAAEDSAALTQASDAMRIAAQCATPGCLAADVELGLSICSRTLQTIAARILSMKPAAALAWLQLTTEWTAIDPTVALDGELTRLRQRQHDVAVGDLITDLANRLERRARFSRTMEIDGRDAATAAMAEAWGEDGALLEFVQQAAAEMLKGDRFDHEEQTARLILRIAGQPTDASESLTKARQLATERGAVLLDPLFMPLERYLSETWKLLADRPTIQAFADAERRRREAFADNPFIDDVPYAPHYGHELASAYAELLRAALTAQASGSRLEEIAERWPAPYGPLRVCSEGEAVTLESARCAFNQKRIGLRLTLLVEPPVTPSRPRSPRPNQ